MPPAGIIVRHLGRRAYEPVWHAMQAFTDRRDASTGDELWVVEHEPVFTQGRNGKPEPLLLPGDIPVVAVDRGGQVTYHGPGQVVVYALLDLHRLGIGVRGLVDRLEAAVVDSLAGWGIEGRPRRDAPGVYVDEAKIASVGLRIRRGCSFHGLALNVAMDLEPFSRINPCGYEGLTVTQVSDLGGPADWPEAAEAVVSNLVRGLGYTETVGPADAEPNQPMIDCG